MRARERVDPEEDMRVALLAEAVKNKKPIEHQKAVYIPPAQPGKI
jgi:hypothetical protein